MCGIWRISLRCSETLPGCISCEIADALDMTQSSVSHQLRVLRQNALVKYRKEGKTVYYSLDDDHVRSVLEQGTTHICHKRGYVE